MPTLAEAAVVVLATAGGATVVRFVVGLLYRAHCFIAHLRITKEELRYRLHQAEVEVGVLREVNQSLESEARGYRKYIEEQNKLLRPYR